jgi:hypothetical protein
VEKYRKSQGDEWQLATFLPYYARLPGGIKEPWGDGNVFDEILFYQPVERAE